MPAGRPSDYKLDYCDAVREFGKEGMSVAEICLNLDCSKATFYNWQEKHPEFLVAVKEARSSAQGWWEKQGREATFGKTPGFNATSFIFNMKNRFREDWTDMTHAQVTADVKTEEVGQGAVKLATFIDAITSRTNGEPSE